MFGIKKRNKKDSIQQFKDEFKRTHYMVEDRNMTTLKLGDMVVFNNELCKVVCISCTKLLVEDCHGELHGWIECNA